jgi:predicted  nucleic acid-binding Zn-ribbon protein
MPYKCVHCSELYDNGSKAVLEGCNKCGRKFFFYIKEDRVNLVLKNQEELKLNVSEKNQIEKDVREIAGVENEETPVFLDFESIKIIKPGKYLLDLAKLFSLDKPRVYKLEDGKYIVDLSSKLKVLG